ncbi:protein ariadne [Nannochloropsis gaditana]|uniref:RBR-type E3 ubiquitin transferase n=1 Tax=Nannochloropsis gaditana TaxID=72520 RepID=W7TIV0_9STRA|nr:protein ariadne [Nannochloropsis gaditana]
MRERLAAFSCKNFNAQPPEDTPTRIDCKFLSPRFFLQKILPPEPSTYYFNNVFKGKINKRSHGPSTNASTTLSGLSTMFHRLRRKNDDFNTKKSLSTSYLTSHHYCPICLEWLPPKHPLRFLSLLLKREGLNFAAATACCPSGHEYCIPCLTIYVNVSINEGRTSHETLRCPLTHCSTPFQDTLLHSLATAEAWEKHKYFVNEAKVCQNPLLRWCPQSNCNGVARLTHAPQQDHEGIYVSATCPVCSEGFCGNCGGDPHRSKKCDQSGNQAYAMWKKRKGDAVKPCPGCGHHIEKGIGCNAMTCTRCRTKWCWSCGLKANACTCVGMRFAMWHEENQQFPPLHILFNGMIIMVATAWVLVILSVCLLTSFFYGTDKMVRRILFYRRLLYETCSFVWNDVTELVTRPLQK